VLSVIPLKIPLFKTKPSLPLGMFSAAKPIGLADVVV
jgi:hypothetical protein